MEVYIATCKLGLEGSVAHGLRELGAQNVQSQNARVYFEGDYGVLCAACLWLRTAERVFLRVAEFQATSFDQLFQGVRAVDWRKYVEKDGYVHVKGKTAKSGLHSVSDCQKIVKKAIVESLRAGYRMDLVPETGRKYIVEVGMLGDTATIAMDATGAGLSRRGYRLDSEEAPLSETLSAGIVDLCRYKSGVFRDPMCGSGTIAIEAAMRAANIAPGLGRPFALEQWGFLPAGLMESARQEARAAANTGADYEVFGSDISQSAIQCARSNAQKAGVKVRFEVGDALALKPAAGEILACNPPYGERLMDKRQAETLYKAMGRVLLPGNGGSVSVLTSHPQFERWFGKRADRRRKLSNGGINCQLFQYFGEKQDQ